MTNVALVNQKQVAPDVSLESARAIASEYISRAGNRDGFDANAVLRERPELQVHKSVVLDLAYEEFLRNTEAGRALNAHSFASRFPQWESSLLRMLHVHDFLDDSAIFATPEWPVIGDEFAGFQLREELGRGAFSRVYLACEVGVGGRNVVVKACANVHSDANTLGRLQHPHVVPVYSVSNDQASGLTAICMPYLGRATLYDVLESVFGGDGSCPRHGIVLHEVIEQANQLDDELASLGRSYPFSDLSYVDAVLEISIQIAAALKYVHRRGIFHCDIKPTNVLLTASGEARLFDFNLALAGSAAPERIGGTLAYMAPELLASFANGDLAGDVKVDERTDIFSFAVMMYELLSGKLPFDLPRNVEDRHEVARQLLERQAAGPPSLAQANPAVNRSLAEAIERCLLRERESRPANSADLLAILQRERTRRRRPSRRRFLAVAGGGVLLCASAVALLPRLETAQTELPAMERAQREIQAGNYSAAIEFYDQAIGQNPQNARAHFQRGNANLCLDQFGAAITDFAHAKRLGWDPAAANMSRVRAEFHRGRQLVSAELYADAMRDFKEAGLGLLSNPDLRREMDLVRTYEAYCLMHRSMERGPDYQGALRLFEELSKTATTAQRVSIYNNLGHCYRLLGETGLSERYFIKAASIPSQHDQPCRNLAQVRLAICQANVQVANAAELIRQAVDSIEQALRRNPSRFNYFFAVETAAKATQLSIELNDEDAAGAYQELAVSYAGQAIDAGIEPSWLRKANALCKRLAEDPRLQALIGEETVVKSSPIRCSPVIEPLVNDELLGRLKINR